MSEPAVTASTNPWETIFHCAVQFHGSGSLNEAGSLFAAIVEHNPDHFPSLHRLAAIRRQQGRLQDSLALLERAVECNPTAADVHNSLGNTLSGLQRYEDAIVEYHRAASLRENFPEAHLNLGNSLKAMGRYDEAAEAYRAAIALRPPYAEAHSNLGIVLARLNCPSEAAASFATAISIDPGIKLGYSNLGLALTALNRHEEALPYFQRARLLDPGAPQPVFNESVVHLALGDFERGWPDYEARWRVPELKMKLPDFAQPHWDGQSSLAGKTILLHSEQGLGDTILFARFVEPIVHRASRVYLDVQGPLTSLMKSIPGVAQVLTAGDPLPEFDLHAPFGSLPLALKTTVDTIPSRTPYLRAPAESETVIGLDESSGSPSVRGPLVGVCWAGNPDYPLDHNRSIPLSIFGRLFQVPGVRFVSLQQNLRPGDDEILARYDDVNLTSDAKSKGLADTAALISKLDLVITVDTVIGHLAGALNRPVWILVSFSAYWAWLRGRTDSPWYPSARLFRQPGIGDWGSVVEEAAGALARAAGSGPPLAQR